MASYYVCVCACVCVLTEIALIKMSELTEYNLVIDPISKIEWLKEDSVFQWRV